MAEFQETDIDRYTEEENDLVAKIKKELEGWREVLLPINKVLTWEKPPYPVILVSGITFIFFLIWYFDPSVLTTFSLLGLIISLVDYLVPTIASSLFKSDNWTVVQEKEFENICIRIHNAKVHIQNLRTQIFNLKTEKPKTYFIAVVITLLVTAYIGNLIDNLLLTYLIVVFLVLLPGLRHHGIIQKYTSTLTSKVKEFIQSKTKKAKKN
ncbi:ADP-ribosylation factor-like protein 6-interacting protein 1 [Tubulanus polymorphus]|uniref:ADP-ribosylation factor-like protein 6-interacting protein 1 n=1 Tax=Tubulanus polymorphus TaxID=672921 RepID=UPI003DA1FF71